MTMGKWETIDSAPEGVPILTKIDDEHGVRNVQRLVKRTRIPGETRAMYWTEDGTMYVYYTPTHWQSVSK